MIVGRPIYPLSGRPKKIGCWRNPSYPHVGDKLQCCPGKKCHRKVPFVVYLCYLFLVTTIVAHVVTWYFYVFVVYFIFIVYYLQNPWCIPMLVFPEPSGGPLLHSHCDPSNSGELQELIVKGWRMFLIQIVAVIGCHYVIDALFCKTVLLCVSRDQCFEMSELDTCLVLPTSGSAVRMLHMVMASEFGLFSSTR